MVVRKILNREITAFRKLQSIAFLYPINVAELEAKEIENPDAENEQNLWGCFTDDGTLVSSMVNTAYSIYYDGHVVKMGGIGGVASAPESRMQGGIRSIFERVFEDDKQNGVLFSVLFPFSHRYYRKFGYEICHEGRILKFPTQELKGYRQTATARLHEAAEGSKPFAHVYDQYARQYNYAVARTDRDWKHVLDGDPYKAEAYRYILSRDGVDTAYCVFKAERTSSSTQTMVVRDYAYVDTQALHDLLGFLYKLSAQFEAVQLEVPDDFEPSALVEEPYDVSPVSLSRSMARAHSVQRALELMRHPLGEGSYSLSIQDDFLPENNGTYQVHYGGEGVQVTRTQQETCDVAMTIQTFTQLCLGFLSFDMACLKKDVTLYGNEDMLRRVFIKKPGFLTDRF